MSRDLILMDSSGNFWSYDNISTRAFLNGKGPGIEIAAAHVKSEAMELFAIGKDKEAVALRDLANKLLQIAKSHDDASLRFIKEKPENPISLSETDKKEWAKWTRRK